MASERVQRRIARLIDHIEAAADQRDWQLVLRLSEDMLAVDPANADAKVYVRPELDPAGTGDHSDRAGPAAKHRLAPSADRQPEIPCLDSFRRESVARERDQPTREFGER